MRNVSYKSYRSNQIKHFVQYDPKVIGMFSFLNRRHTRKTHTTHWRVGQATDGNMAHAYCMLDT